MYFETKLDEWMYENRKTDSQVAKELDFTRQHIWNIRTGAMPAGKKAAKVLHIYTNGEISLLNLMGMED